MAVKLTGHQIEVVLTTLEGWTQDAGRIKKEYKFTDFTGAAMFITGANLEAEKMNHHPNWSNSYNKVRISLFTHDSKTITDKDILLARKIQQLAQQIPN